MNSINQNWQPFDPVKFIKALIAIPSFSGQENESAALIENVFLQNNIPSRRVNNNVWALNKYFDQSQQTLLLNSHHDTVKPNTGYTLDPFLPVERDGKIYGLGSNDAGASLASLLAVFLKLYEQDLPFNLVFAASSEEEISGKNGMELLLEHLPPIDMAIVGEPTKMEMAIAEKGLLVLDCTAEGKAGHAARDEGENAIYNAIKDIQWFRDFNFEKESPYLGKVHMAVTSIESQNKAHNIVPSQCKFVVDVRVNELYSLEEVIETIRKKTSCDVQPRSIRLKPSFISSEHALVLAGTAIGLPSYGSPTLSDMALMNFPAIKLGPGDSARSHIADEYVYVHEIKNGIKIYLDLLEELRQKIKSKHS